MKHFGYSGLNKIRSATRVFFLLFKGWLVDACTSFMAPVNCGTAVGGGTPLEGVTVFQTMFSSWGSGPLLQSLHAGLVKNANCWALPRNS